MTDTAMQNDAIDLRLLKSLWLEFFSLDNEGDIEKLPDSYFKQHDRYGAIQAFKNFFDNQCLCQGKHNIFSHKCILRNLQKTAHLEELNVTLDMSQMSASFQYDDFMSTLVSDPAEVMGCLNMAISLLIWEFSNAAVNFPCMPFPIYARLTKLPCQMSSFSDLKANACGRLVAIKGHVIRVSACSPLIAKGIFKCVKCSEITAKIFHDGIFAPVRIRCLNKNSQQVSTSDCPILCHNTHLTYILCRVMTGRLTICSRLSAVNLSVVPNI